MKRFLICSALLLGLFSSGQWTQAGIIGSTIGNDDEAISWLESQGHTGLTKLAKQNIGGSLEWDYKDGFSLESGGAGRADTWTYDNAGVTPKFWAVKFSNVMAIYEYMGPASSPFTDSFDLDADFFTGTDLLVDIDAPNGTTLVAAGSYDAKDDVFKLQSDGFKNLNVEAGTSHVSVYGMTTSPPGEGPGVVPEPASAVFWLGALGVIGATRRRRR